jgi:hypothetical protein
LVAILLMVSTVEEDSNTCFFSNTVGSDERVLLNLVNMEPLAMASRCGV